MPLLKELPLNMLQKPLWEAMLKIIPASTGLLQVIDTEFRPNDCVNGESESKIPENLDLKYCTTDLKIS